MHKKKQTSNANTPCVSYTSRSMCGHLDAYSFPCSAVRRRHAPVKVHTVALPPLASLRPLLEAREAENNCTKAPNCSHLRRVLRESRVKQLEMDFILESRIRAGGVQIVSAPSGTIPLMFSG